jgi:hypothetical protein
VCEARWQEQSLLTKLTELEAFQIMNSSDEFIRGNYSETKKN